MNETKFRVVTVTDDIKAYPQYEEDTKEFPELVYEVEDDFQSFVINTETGRHYTADEFFFMVNVKSFTAEVIADE